MKVLPLRKLGDAHSYKVFRPISNLISFSKLFNKIVHHKLVEFLNNQIISVCQFGFHLHIMELLVSPNTYYIASLKNPVHSVNFITAIYYPGY